MGNCTSCKKEDELRFGVCFSCASSGESKAANRTVFQHLKTAIKNAQAKQYEYAGYDLKWAWQRLTRTGDYSKDGYFDSEGHNWRKP